MMNEIWNRENIPDSYIAEDGLLHCSLCGGPLEVRLPEYNEFFKSDKGFALRIVGCGIGHLKTMTGRCLRWLWQSVM